MTKFITITRIKFVMNFLIIIILLQGSFLILSELHLLLFKPEKIGVLKLDIPWHHPIDPVTVMFDKTKLQNNPDLHQKMKKNVFLYDLITRAIFIPLMILILIHIKKLIIAIRGKTFFELKNILIIRNLSLITGAWVLSNFILYQILPLFIPQNLIFESINYITLKDSILSNLIIAIDFKMLLVAIMLYVISILFREGYQLKEQSDLTI